MYFNKRAEVWGAMRDWIHAGAEIPDDPELEQDLTGPMYYFSNKNQIQLEKKDDMKSRGLSSPDTADCLAMTFAVKVAPPAKKTTIRPPGGAMGWMG
jgi:phage terminase large subunit